MACYPHTPPSAAPSDSPEPGSRSTPGNSHDSPGKAGIGRSNSRHRYTANSTSPLRRPTVPRSITDRLDDPGPSASAGGHGTPSRHRHGTIQRQGRTPAPGEQQPTATAGTSRSPEDGMEHSGRRQGRNQAEHQVIETHLPGGGGLQGRNPARRPKRTPWTSSKLRGQSPGRAGASHPPAAWARNEPAPGTPPTTETSYSRYRNERGPILCGSGGSDRQKGRTERKCPPTKLDQKGEARGAAPGEDEAPRSKSGPGKRRGPGTELDQTPSRRTRPTAGP